jgi:hypothetical protein
LSTLCTESPGCIENSEERSLSSTTILFLKSPIPPNEDPEDWNLCATRQSSLDNKGGGYLGLMLSWE